MANPESAPWEQKFIHLIERFMQQTGTPPTVLGRQALNDPAFIIHLRAGRSPSLRVADRVRAYIYANSKRTRA
jgi:hypothetical protein